MGKQALLFIAVFFFGNLSSLIYGPFYGLLTYIHIYFNIPTHQYWANQVPSLRWSFIGAIILVISCFLHQKKLSKGASYITFNILIGYFILIIVSALSSPVPSVAFPTMYAFLRYVIIFFLVIKIINSLSHYRYVALLLVLETFNICLLGQARFQGGRLDDVGIVDATSSNQFGGMLAIVLPFVFSLFFTGNKYVKLICLITGPIILNVFMMCGSRGAFVGLFSIITTLLFESVKIKQIRIKVILTAIVGIILVGLMMGESYRDRLFSTADEDATASQLSAGRTEIWKYGFLMSKDYPFGAGGGAFIALSPYYMPAERIESSVGGRASHSTYILTLVEQGWMGLLLYCSYLFCSLRMLYKSKIEILKNLKREKNSEKYVHFFIYCTGLQASIVGLAVTSIFADRLYYEMLYLIGAFAVCLSNIVNRAIRINNATD